MATSLNSALDRISGAMREIGANVTGVAEAAAETLAIHHTRPSSMPPGVASASESHHRSRRARR